MATEARLLFSSGEWAPRHVTARRAAEQLLAFVIIAWSPTTLVGQTPELNATYLARIHTPAGVFAPLPLGALASPARLGFGAHLHLAEAERPPARVGADPGIVGSTDKMFGIGIDAPLTKSRGVRAALAVGAIRSTCRSADGPIDCPTGASASVAVQGTVKSYDLGLVPRQKIFSMSVMLDAGMGKLKSEARSAAVTTPMVLSMPLQTRRFGSSAIAYVPRLALFVEPGLVYGSLTTGGSTSSGNVGQITAGAALFDLNSGRAITVSGRKSFPGLRPLQFAIALSWHRRSNIGQPLAPR